MAQWNKIIISGSDSELNSLSSSLLNVGTQGSSYSFPTSSGEVDQVLTMNDDNQLSFVDVTDNLPAGTLSSSQQIVDALDGQDLSLGVVSASILHEIYTTQSINLGSGSFQFGDTLDDTHTFTGSVNITGSLNIGIIDVSASIASLEDFSSSLDNTFATDSELQNLIDKTGSYATTSSNTFTDNQTINASTLEIDNAGDAQIVLDRGANSNDAEIAFQTNDTLDWTIGTGQVGGDADFTIRHQNNNNIFRLSGTGLNINTPVSASEFTGSFNGIFNGAVSSSAQIASDISGALSNTAIAELGAGIISSSQDGFGRVSVGITGSLSVSQSVEIIGDITSVGKILQNREQRSTFMGFEAGINEDDGNRYNVGLGYRALCNLNNGTRNVAIGFNAMDSLDDGDRNVGIGSWAGAGVVSGNENTYVGVCAGADMSGGNRRCNVGIGYRAAYQATTGDYNTSIGTLAGENMTEGSGNVQIGWRAGNAVTTGQYNISIGTNSDWSNICGDCNVVIGYNARNGGTIDDHVIVIGTNAVGRGDHTVTIGSSIISSSRLYGTLEIDGIADVSASIAALEAGDIILPDGTVSSSAQLASDISGSFNNISASIASDISASETRINSLEASVFSTDGTGILSSSAQIASDISGAFDSVSASLASDIAGISTDFDDITNKPVLYSGSTQLVSALDGQDITLGRVNATEIVTEIVSSSISFSTGSNIFGDELSDNHEFTGSINVTGSITATSFTGDGSGLTGITADSVTFANVTNKPTLVSSSNQLEGFVSQSADFVANEFIVANGANSVTSSNLLSVDMTEQRIGIGTSTPEVKLDIVGNAGGEAQVRIAQHDNSTDGPDMRFFKSRGTVDSPAAVNDNDYVGAVNAFVYDGSNYQQGGFFGFQAEGTDGDTTFDIRTRVNGNLSQRITVDATGDVDISGSLTAQSATVDDFTINDTLTANTITGSLLRLSENGSGLRLTNVGAFENSEGDFHIFATAANLRFSTLGSSNERLRINANGISGSVPFSGSFVGDGSALTGITADSVTFDNVINKPTLFSSSAQLSGSDVNFDVISGSNLFVANTGSIAWLNIMDQVQLNGAGSQYFAYNEDTVKVKFANWYNGNENQFGQTQLWNELAFIATNGTDHKRISFYLDIPDSGSTDSVSGVHAAHGNNNAMFINGDGVSITNDLKVTGSLYGDGSNLTFAGTGIISSSNQVTFDSASYAETATTASFVAASAVTNVTTYRETVSGATSYAITHNLNEEYPIVQAWNTSNNQMEIPASITSDSVNQVTVDFGLTFAGQIVVKI